MAISQLLVFTQHPLELIVSLCGQLAFPSWLSHSVIRTRSSTSLYASKCICNGHLTLLTSMFSSMDISITINVLHKPRESVVSWMFLIGPIPMPNISHGTKYPNILFFTWHERYMKWQLKGKINQKKCLPSTCPPSTKPADGGQS